MNITANDSTLTIRNPQEHEELRFSMESPTLLAARVTEDDASQSTPVDATDMIPLAIWLVQARGTGIMNAEPTEQELANIRLALPNTMRGGIPGTIILPTKLTLMFKTLKGISLPDRALQTVPEQHASVINASAHPAGDDGGTHMWVNVAFPGSYSEGAYGLTASFNTGTSCTSIPVTVGQGIPSDSLTFDLPGTMVPAVAAWLIHTSTYCMFTDMNRLKHELRVIDPEVMVDDMNIRTGALDARLPMPFNYDGIPR